ncbi:hypothetical protein N9L47_06305 [Rhodobacteraceae bacterium]|nr:hypothetical protein [Paracoccaceae bacterium]
MLRLFLDIELLKKIWKSLKLWPIWHEKFAIELGLRSIILVVPVFFTVWLAWFGMPLLAISSTIFIAFDFAGFGSSSIVVCLVLILLGLVFLGPLARLFIWFSRIFFIQTDLIFVGDDSAHARLQKINEMLNCE